MADSDWTAPAGVNGSIIAQPTLEIVTPNSADPYSFGFNSASDDTVSYSARSYSRAGFTFKSGSASTSALRRITADLGGSVFVYAGHGNGDDGDVGLASDICYKLGLQDGVTPHIVLCKGPLEEGIPSGDPGSTSGGTKILMKGAETWAATLWVHVRLVTSVQFSGDVVVECFQSQNGNFLAPIFETIPGMQDKFIDGTTQINTGSAPLVEGRPGYGMHSFVQNMQAGATYQQFGNQPVS